MPSENAYELDNDKNMLMGANAGCIFYGQFVVDNCETLLLTHILIGE